MLSLRSNQERIVGVLHDVVEDGKEKGWMFDRLRAEGFSNEVLAALEPVTKRPEDEDLPGDDEATKFPRYLRFVARAAQNTIGLKVKLADLRGGDPEQKRGCVASTIGVD